MSARLVHHLTPPQYELRLLGGFALVADGRPAVVPPGSQRVLALLAIHDRPVARGHVAATLWPDTRDEKAAANLRTALWRLHEAGLDVVAGNGDLCLRPDVWVDCRALGAAARRLRQAGEPPPPAVVELLERCCGELLPGWWEPWLDLDRERLRLEHVHLCEAVAGAALDDGDPHLAALAALSALACDPLCEPSHLFLIRAHLASGRRIEAGRAFDRYAAIVRQELGVEPSRSIESLVAV